MAARVRRTHRQRLRGRDSRRYEGLGRLALAALLHLWCPLHDVKPHLVELEGGGRRFGGDGQGGELEPSKTSLERAVHGDRGLAESRGTLRLEDIHGLGQHLAKDVVVKSKRPQGPREGVPVGQGRLGDWDWNWYW